MMIFIEQPDSAALNEAANTLSEKLSEQAKEGAVIKLTPHEVQLNLGDASLAGTVGGCVVVSVLVMVCLTLPST